MNNELKKIAAAVQKSIQEKSTAKNISDISGVPYTTLKRKLVTGNFTLQELALIGDALGVNYIDFIAECESMEKKNA